MGKNAKNNKRTRNEEAVKTIRRKQSQKKKEKIAKNIVKTKQEERKEFLDSINKITKSHNQRIDAEIADKKRKEAYLKYAQYEPKLEEDLYFSK